MTNIRFTGISTDLAHHLQAGGFDAYDNTPERTISDGDGVPCRHCLRLIEKGKPYLVFALRPFSSTQPYAETGPAFLCAEECNAPNGAFPEVLTDSPRYITRGYSADERIAYGTGGVTDSGQIADRAGVLLARHDIAFIDVRSASNNCWQARIVRDE